jgi:hypothetical protein
LIAAEAKKAGFDVVLDSRANLFDGVTTNNSKYDGYFYGFGLTSVSQAQGTEIYKSDGGNNTWGWRDATIDNLAKRLQGDVVPASEVTAMRIAIDKKVISNYWGLALYANPTIAAYNKDIKNIKPAPIGNNITWNFFEWSY